MESSDDDISITSTPGSVQKDEYEVEAVIGERAFRGNLMYLVKWAGYPLERCTWEPPNSFCDPQTLADWEAKMEAIAQKKEKPFDVDALLKSIDAIEGAKALRRQRRKAKRIRLEIPVSPSVSSGDTEASWSLNGFIVGDDVDVTAEIPAQTSPQKREEKQKASGTELRRRTDKPQDDKAALSSDSDSPLSKLRNNPGSSPATRKQPSQTNASAGTASTPTSKPASSQPAPASSRPAPPPVSAPKSNDPARKQRPVLSLKTTTKATPSASAPKSAPKSTTSSPSLSSKPRSSAKQFGVPGIGPSNPKRFTTLQLKNRHNKFIRRELVPDISRLDLKTPSEWAAQKQTAFVVPAPPPGRRVSEDSDSLFVEQESPRSFRNRSPIRNDDSGPSRRRSAVAASTARMSKDTSPVKPPPPYKMRSPALPGNWPWRRFKMHSDELFVRLGLGSLNNVIGDVRITGINSRTMKQMVPLRGPHSRIILNFRDTCNFDEYKELCESGESYNEPFANGLVVGYEDTADAVSEAAAYLRDNDLVAVWYHPDDTAQLVLVAYAPDAPSWDFLNRSVLPPLPPTHSLRVLARGIMPPVDSVRNKRPPLHPPQHASPVRQGIHLPAFDLVSPHSPPAPSPHPLVSAPSPSRHHPIPLPAVEKGGIDSIFQKLGISYTELTTILIKNRLERTRSFYLHFPEEYPEVNEEFELLTNFLEHRGAPPPFTNRRDGDWQRFVDNVKIGTVLFHTSFISYDDMPGLNNLLQFPINIFNISLRHPIDGFGGRLQRLFPSGGVILMTEDVILHETSAALDILRWFASYLDRTREWKMFFPPNILQWLLNLFDTWSDDKLYQIYCMIKCLIPEYPSIHYNYDRREGSPESLDGLTDDEGQQHPFISPRDLPGYGTWSGHDAPSNAMSLEEKDTDLLMEYFAGWALMNCDKYRKFYALTRFKPQKRWENWSHLTIKTGASFVRHISPSASKPRSKTRSTSTPASRRSSLDKAMPPPPIPPTTPAAPNGAPMPPASASPVAENEDISLRSEGMDID